MKKKHVVLMIMIIVLTIVSLIGIRFLQMNYKKENAFKIEYESLNEKTTSSGKKYLSISIDDNNKMYYASYQEIIDLLDDGTGVIYFGFPECPWCRNAVPVLLDAAEETSIKKIYYFNAREMRDQKSLDENGNIVTEKEGTDEYKILLKKLDSVLGPYIGLNDSSIKRLYFPTVVFVQDGKILGAHEGTLDTQEDPYIELTVEQKWELKNIYLDGIHEVLDDLCDEKC